MEKRKHKLVACFSFQSIQPWLSPLSIRQDEMEKTNVMHNVTFSGGLNGEYDMPVEIL